VEDEVFTMPAKPGKPLFTIKSLLLALGLSLASAAFAPAVSFSAEEPRAASPNERNALIGFNAVLLGGFIAGQWVSAGDLQENATYHPDRIRGGEDYKVYSTKGFEGSGRGSAIRSGRQGEFDNDPDVSDTQIFDLTMENGQTLGFGTARLAVRCDWDPAPRRATALDIKNDVYNKILQEYLSGNGLPGAKPQIMQLFKVDLEGDGVDEVVIVAQNIVDRNASAAAWGADKPLSLRTGISGDSKKGDYSLVLLRKLAAGKVREIPLSQVIALKGGGPGDAESTPPLLHKVHQFADLNGDGVMEIIITAGYYDGFIHQVYEIKGDRAALALQNGAGH
jgi:hypothetical protein